MCSYLSPEAVEILCTIRVGKFDAQPRGDAPVKLLAQIPSEECGCPEELWFIDGLIVLSHFEENGECEIFVYGGDWETEHSVSAQNMPELRAEMFRVVSQIPTE